MFDGDALLLKVREAEAAEDPIALDAARIAFIEADPHHDEANAARYRLGLSRLFVHQDVAGAIKLFKEASKDKKKAVGQEATISLALCLQSQQKRQQAIFELRKLLPVGVKPTMHTATALDFLALLLRDSGAQVGDIETAETQRQEHLEALAASADEPMEKAHWWLRLAAALADTESRTDGARARALLNQILKLGPQAGESALRSAKASLKALPR